jgi:hypothetical protein
MACMLRAMAAEYRRSFLAISLGGNHWACAPTGCGCPPISLSPGIVVRDVIVRYGESILEYRSLAAVVAARGLQSNS